MEIATLGGGCFWCTEAIFKRLKGVRGVVSGYSGGTLANPSYDQVSSGTTGHTEAIQIEFDPKVLPYKKLLEIFFHLHDPTTLNRQGVDMGTQYRSVIFYYDEKQERTAIKVREEIAKARIYKDPVITEIVPFKEFYPAEEYHQKFYENNPNYGYCTYIINPKLQKLLKEFRNDVKEEYS